MSEFNFPWKMSETATKKVNEMTKIFRVKAGTPLFTEGQVCDMVFQIIEGQAQVHKTTQAGKTLGLYLLEKDNLCPIALQSCLMWQPAMANCTTTKETEVVCLAAADFAKILVEESGLAADVIRFIDHSIQQVADSYVKFKEDNALAAKATSN